MISRTISSSNDRRRKAPLAHHPHPQPSSPAAVKKSISPQPAISRKPNLFKTHRPSPDSPITQPTQTPHHHTIIKNISTTLSSSTKNKQIGIFCVAPRGNHVTKIEKEQRRRILLSSPQARFRRRDHRRKGGSPSNKKPKSWKARIFRNQKRSRGSNERDRERTSRCQDAAVPTNKGISSEIDVTRQAKAAHSLASKTRLSFETQSCVQCHAEPSRARRRGYNSFFWYIVDKVSFVRFA